jgi:hypothetical protein
MLGFSSSRTAYQGETAVLHVQIADVQCVLFDELATALHVLTH